MIRAEIYQSEKQFRGFRVTGHAGYAESGQDIVCAAVTSACMLAANIITDGFHISAKSGAEDNVMLCIADNADERADAVVDMLVQQLEMIRDEYPGTINISYSEV
ncbi:ribosomal-processing cysteine protease Prp [uncultured Ruminococcus sp.]|uniref:ribosomal-processing cysteine protease Prp n=1 Tax=uncultured Ruminococcus sp. TaxID=165186 RepID=UPI0025FB5D71|nr:ribosomal-processing cysteine protease Prp [uncultured Ruminococcus sp.]